MAAFDADLFVRTRARKLTTTVKAHGWRIKLDGMPSALTGEGLDGLARGQADTVVATKKVEIDGKDTNFRAELGSETAAILISGDVPDGGEEKKRGRKKPAAPSYTTADTTP